MINSQKKKVETDVPISVICNKSGKEVDLTSEDNYIDQNMMHSFSVHFGYGSDFDDEAWEFDLDEKVLLEFVKTFKIMPTGFAKDSKYPDKVFKEWVETGEYNWRAGWTEGDFAEEKKNLEAWEERMREFRELTRISKNDL